MAKKKDTGLLLARALDDAERARNELRTARGDLRRYKGKAAKTRARNRIGAAEHKLTLAERRVNKYAEEAEREEGPPEKAAKEWEIGVSYVGNPKKKQAVMVNGRLVRKDGGLLSERDVQRVIRHLHEGGSPKRLPGGVEFHGVRWTRGTESNPGKRTYGEPNDLKSFGDIFGTLGVEDWRVSPVEPDDEF